MATKPLNLGETGQIFISMQELNQTTRPSQNDLDAALLYKDLPLLVFSPLATSLMCVMAPRTNHSEPIRYPMTCPTQYLIRGCTVNKGWAKTAPISNPLEPCKTYALHTNSGSQVQPSGMHSHAHAMWDSTERESMPWHHLCSQGRLQDRDVHA